MEMDIVRRGLARVYMQLCDQHDMIVRNAVEKNVDVYELKDMRGRHVLIDILVAKANVLSAMANLNKN